MPSALEELVAADREIKQAQADFKAAERLHLDPIRARERVAGERANVLWAQVLQQYGSGAAQDALRAAKFAVRAD